MFCATTSDFCHVRFDIYLTLWCKNCYCGKKSFILHMLPLFCVGCPIFSWVAPILVVLPGYQWRLSDFRIFSEATIASLHALPHVFVQAVLLSLHSNQFLRGTFERFNTFHIISQKYWECSTNFRQSSR